MPLPQHVQKIIGAALMLSVLVLANWIRIPKGDWIPDGQFTETDGYFYYWQALLVAEHGHLPERDMHRWLPLGRDLGQTLNLYGYVLAYAHKAVATVFGNVSLYHVALYMPPLCFCIGLGALFLFLYHTYGLLFSGLVGVLLATLPGSIERSAAGFGDRDAWCLMIGILAVTTYLTSLQAQHRRNRLLWTLASGLTVFLGGISWEGFGVFLSVILVVALWRFLTSETEESLGLYLFFLFLFVPMLYLASPAYRSGYGFAKHLSAEDFTTIFDGGKTLCWCAFRDAFASVPAAVKSGQTPSTRTPLSLVFALTSIALALGYVLIQHHTFADTTVPLSQNAVMQAMTELRAPHYGYWVFRYGNVFIVGSLGFVLLPLFLWKKEGLKISIPIALFTVFSSFCQHSDKLWGEPVGNVLFGIALAGCAVGLLRLAWRRKTKSAVENEGTSFEQRKALRFQADFVFIAFIAWFIVWVALARDAKRYDFFIGVALSFGAAALIQLITQALSEKLHHSVYVTDKFRPRFKPATLKTGGALILLTGMMFLQPPVLCEAVPALVPAHD